MKRYETAVIFEEESGYYKRFLLKDEKQSLHDDVWFVISNMNDLGWYVTAICFTPNGKQKFVLTRQI